jgi:hypothetical protein
MKLMVMKNKIYSLEDKKTICNSIDSLAKIILFKFEKLDSSFAIETYTDLINFYNRFTDKDIKEYIKDKLQWINQHPKTDVYYFPRIIKLFEENIK